MVSVMYVPLCSLGSMPLLQVGSPTAHLHRGGTHAGAKLPEEISSLLSEIFSLTFNMLGRKVTSESQSHRTPQCAGLVC